MFEYKVTAPMHFSLSICNAVARELKSYKWAHLYEWKKLDQEVLLIAKHIPIVISNGNIIFV